MEPKLFIEKYYPFAEKIQNEYGISAIAILAQSAFESGWGEKAIGFNLWGIKFKKGDFGYRKVLTTEYSKNTNAFNCQEIVSKTFDSISGLYKFKVYQYFADYENQYDAFKSYAKLLTSERYKSALSIKDPVLYLAEIAKLGYATDPNYGSKMKDMVKSIEKRL